MRVLLLSGGFDSSSLLHIKGGGVGVEIGLFVDYGQPARTEEKKFAEQVARDAGVEFIAMKTDFFLGAMAEPTGQPGPRVVAVRNMMLIALGANLAAARGFHTVVIGSTQSDEEDYPDCRKDFFDAADALMSDTYGVGVFAPLLSSRKIDIARHATDCGYLDKLMASSWSCYTPVEPLKECGHCNSCVARKSLTEDRIG